MRMRWLAGLTAALVLATPAASAWAEPELSVSGLRNAAGVVEFYLSAQGLPAGADLAAVTVTVDGKQLEVSADEVSKTDITDVPRRVVMLVLDTSGSMAGAPLVAARSAATEYLAQLPADVHVGLVTAGAPAKVALRPTRDRAAARKAIGSLAAVGETSLYDGVKQATDLMTKGEWAQRRIVLLSDGADTSSATTLDAVRKATVAAGIAVDTIAFRTEEATVSTLADLATGTGGSPYTAEDTAGLQKAFAGAAGSFTAQLLVRVTVPPELSGAETSMVIAAGGASTELSVQFAVDTSAAEPLVEVSAPPPSSTFLLIAVAIVFGAALAASLLVVGPALASRRSAGRREDELASPVTQARAAATPSHVTQAALAISAQLVKSTHAEGRIAQQLDRAGMRLRPHEWLLLRAVVSFVLLVLISMIGGLKVGLLLGPLLGILLTALYHRNRASKRVNAFADALPDALQLIVGSLRSGFSLHQSIGAMIKELPDPISTEFGRALGETRLGADLEDALERLATRMQSRDLGWAVVAVRVQREVGGNLAEVLSTTVDTMRERDSLRRHVRSLSAEGRLSAWVLLMLPIGVGSFMIAFRGQYIEPLYTEPLGILMSIVGVLLLLIGAFWLSRLVKVEV